MKKKTIVFFADMRTTYDTSFYDSKKVDVSEKFIEFTKKYLLLLKMRVLM